MRLFLVIVLHFRTGLPMRSVSGSLPPKKPFKNQEPSMDAVMP